MRHVLMIGEKVCCHDSLTPMAKRNEPKFSFAWPRLKLLIQESLAASLLFLDALAVAT
ncbi:MAG: hypothetical protein ABIN01_15610 [Ferruginibacter sp.]